VVRELQTECAEDICAWRYQCGGIGACSLSLIVVLISTSSFVRQLIALAFLCTFLFILPCCSPCIRISLPFVCSLHFVLPCCPPCIAVPLPFLCSLHFILSCCAPVSAIFLTFLLSFLLVSSMLLPSHSVPFLLSDELLVFI
jgi:hypothetical protein